tara:strand:+ start:1308 stop:2063 length:756 start_codon:yes stop_codon:yes gene_type:complete
MVKNRKHTHKGTCQSCGRVQAVKVDGKIAEHGFTVEWGRVGSCDGSDKQPLEINTEFNEDKVRELEIFASDENKIREQKVFQDFVRRSQKNSAWHKHELLKNGGTPVVVKRQDPSEISQKTVDRIVQSVKDHINTLNNLRNERFGKPLYEAAYVRKIVEDLEESMAEFRDYCNDYLNTYDFDRNASRKLYKDENNNSHFEEYVTSLGLVKLVTKYNGIDYAKFSWEHDTASFRNTFYLDGEKVTKKALLAM